jgi:CheY-like chemotaxis protein
MLTFEVEDTGLGIAPEEMDSLFNAFVQTESGRKSQSGTGLGLAISHRLVTLMGGEIQVRSTLRQGSIFQFTIPVAVMDDRPASVNQAVHRVIGIDSQQPTYRILVVDDSLENRQLLTKRLISVGFEVQAAENGQRAIEVWEKYAPHLIWMDIRMPIMNGLEATRQIRLRESQLFSCQPTLPLNLKTSGDRPHPTKIIAITANVFEDAKQPILEIGCDDFVAKPCPESVFFEKMSEHLGVKYVYETQQVNPHLPSPERYPDNGTSRLKLQPETFQVMPPDWITQLNFAARRADETAIFALLSELPDTQTELKFAITELVEQFQLEQLIQLTGHPITE